MSSIFSLSLFPHSIFHLNIQWPKCAPCCYTSHLFSRARCEFTIVFLILTMQQHIFFCIYSHSNLNQSNICWQTQCQCTISAIECVLMKHKLLCTPVQLNWRDFSEKQRKKTQRFLFRVSPSKISTINNFYNFRIRDFLISSCAPFVYVCLANNCPKWYFNWFRLFNEWVFSNFFFQFAVLKTVFGWLRLRVPNIGRRSIVSIANRGLMLLLLLLLLLFFFLNDEFLLAYRL